MKRSLNKALHTADFKLSVLQQMWDEGLSRQEVASLLNICSPASVSIWQRQYHESAIHALETRPKDRRPSVMPTPTTRPLAVPKQSDTRTREELLEELEYLRAENAYLKKLDAPLKEKEQQGQRQMGQKKKRK